MNFVDKSNSEENQIATSESKSAKCINNLVKNFAHISDFTNVDGRLYIWIEELNRQLVNIAEKVQPKTTCFRSHNFRRYI